MLFPIAAAVLAVVPFVLRSDSTSSTAVAKLCTLLYLAVRLLPLLVRLAGISIGRSICAKTQQRRELILARAEQEENDFRSKRRKEPRGEDEDWEKIGCRPPGSSTPGDQENKDWQGVVGFFHPFW